MGTHAPDVYMAALSLRLAALRYHDPGLLAALKDTLCCLSYPCEAPALPGHKRAALAACSRRAERQSCKYQTSHFMQHGNMRKEQHEEGQHEEGHWVQ